MGREERGGGREGYIGWGGVGGDSERMATVLGQGTHCIACFDYSWSELIRKVGFIEVTRLIGRPCILELKFI